MAVAEKARQNKRSFADAQDCPADLPDVVTEEYRADVKRVIRMVDLAEYKRRQSAPGPKISLKAFGRDRRLPITNRWREIH